jgi:hypothetical protein
MAANKLNLVFHGTFSFHVLADGSGIDVLIPDVKDHAYYAGPWQTGQLKQLTRGATYDLKLAHKDLPDHFADDPANRDSNVFVSAPQITPSAKLFATFRLRPLPDEIRTLQRITVQTNNFLNTNDPSVRKIPDRVLGLVHVLTYELSGQVPTVNGINPPVAGKDRSIVNLHVFADPPLQTGNQLTEGAFHDLMSFNPANPLEFIFPPDEIALVEPSGNVPGLRTIELVSLASSNLLTPAQLARDPIAVDMIKSAGTIRTNFLGCVSGHICVSSVSGPR